VKQQYCTGCTGQAGRCNFEWGLTLCFPAFCKYMKLTFARKWALFAHYSSFIRKTNISIHSCCSVWVVDLIAVMYRSWPAGIFFCVCGSCDYQYLNMDLLHDVLLRMAVIFCLYLVLDWCGVSVSRFAGTDKMGVVPFVRRGCIRGQMCVCLGQIILKFL
jgi:hypothetical protein